MSSSKAKAPGAGTSVRGEYIETETGNKISRRASILGPKHIMLAGRCVVQADAVIHGDLVRPPSSGTEGGGTSVQLGRYVFVSAGAVLHPPQRGGQYYPLRIGDGVFVGRGTVVRAAEIRPGVHIGAGCVLGNLCVVRDNVRILDGAVLPAHSVWASGCVVAGRPARVVGDVGEAWGVALAGAGDATAAAATTTTTTTTKVGSEGVGVRARERWAAVGNKR